MPLVDMKDMLQHAYDHGYAVGAFDLVGMEFLEGVLAAAERARAPVILSLVEAHFEYFDFELLMPAIEAAAKRASVPVAIHQDHGSSLEAAIRAIKLGCNGVMVDASDMDFGENIRITRSVVDMAHACGMPVEGELGYVPGVEGEDAERHPGELAYTTPAEARAYVERTGVDFLAISIGTVHGHMKGKPKLDYHRLKQINEALAIPLVIHGGSGLSDDQFRRLITNGVAKVNYYTALAGAAGASIRENARADRSSNYTGLVKDVKAVISSEVESKMRLWGSAGRAAEVLSRCRLWRPVERLVIYSAEGIDETRVEMMMAEGRQLLGTIPGVREVVTGKAVQENEKYRYTWLVRFCHPAVIDSYLKHPDHVAFSDKIFRPVAGNQISINFNVVETVSSGHIHHDIVGGGRR